MLQTGKTRSERRGVQAVQDVLVRGLGRKNEEIVNFINLPQFSQSLQSFFYLASKFNSQTNDRSKRF
jgi:hypothetical protein